MTADSVSSSHRSRRFWWLNFLSIALFWALYLLIQVPIPGVNEPHYLCKAKHFWQPEYCSGDFFLDSSNTHWMFYLAFGWMTKFWSLEIVSLVGRVVGIGLLAASWTSLTHRLSSVPWAPIGSAALFLGLTSWQNFSGEWIVGGIESKVIAYGFLLTAWAQLFDQRWLNAAVLMGAAISFHPVVAGWGLIATGLGMSGLWYRRRYRSKLPSLNQLLLSLAVTIVCALPGLIPALSSLQTKGVDSAEADRLQVFRRLGHHLNPVQFSISAYLVYGLLLLAWGVCLWKSRVFRRENQADNRNLSFAQALWQSIILGSLLIAGAGLAIGWLNAALDVPSLNQLLIKLMKFYPFRLVDVLLPLAVSLLVIDTCQSGRTKKSFQRRIAVGLVCLVSAAVALSLQMPSRHTEKYSPEKMASWVDICKWADKNLPADAIILTPTSSKTFRWFASRASYVTFKDCPQDAAGILEWYRRLILYQSWASDSFRNDKLFSNDELHEIAELTGASYLIASRMGPFEKEPIHRNQHYRVYRLNSQHK